MLPVVGYLLSCRPTCFSPLLILGRLTDK